MDYPEGRYYRVNVFLLSMIGQGPYQKGIYRKIAQPIVLLLLSSATFIQVAKLVVEGFDIRVVIEVVPVMIIAIMCLIYAPFSYANVSKNRRLLTAIRNDWQRKRLPVESKIKHRYARIGKLVTDHFSVYVWSMIVVMFIPSVYSQILDVIVPLNESRPRLHPFEFEMFVDKEKYFYPLVTYEHAVMVAGLSMVLANQNIGVNFAQHACGMFAVIGYRLENLASICKIGASNERQYHEAIIKCMRKCVKDHLLALKFTTLLSETIEAAALIVLTGTAISVSIMLVAIMYPQLLTLKTIPAATGQVVHLFIICFTGQLISDASEEVSQKTFNGEWYNYLLPVQKTVLIVILRAGRPCSLSVNEFRQLNLKNFSIVMQTGLSYCMVFINFL